MGFSHFSDSIKPNDMAATAPSADNPFSNARPNRPVKLPSSLDMIKQAIAALRVPGPASRKGVSAHAIKAFIASNIRPDVANRHLNRAFRRAIVTGDLIHTKGLKVAVGSFKLPPKKPAPKKTEKESPKKTKPSDENKPRKVPTKHKSSRNKVIPLKASLGKTKNRS